MSHVSWQRVDEDFQAARVLPDAERSRYLDDACGDDAELRREVETIVLKALSKEKERRYHDAGPLGDDIERFLAGRPIDTKRDSVLYVLRKTLARYKAPLAVAAGFALLVAAGLVASITLWRVAAADRDRLDLANQQAAEALKRVAAAETEAVGARDVAVDGAIERLKPRGLAGRAYFIVGPSGVGKTTLAYLLAREIADDWFIDEMDAQELNMVPMQKVEASFQLRAPGKGGRVLVVNEAHGLYADTLRRLLVVIERLPVHVAIIFTAPAGAYYKVKGKSDDWMALLSRCTKIVLNSCLEGAAAHVKRIAAAEGLDGQPIEAYEALAERCEHNIRAMPSAVEEGAV